MKRPSENMFIELSEQLTQFKFNNVRWINSTMQITGPITYVYSRTSSKGTLTYFYYINMSSASLGLL